MKISTNISFAILSAIFLISCTTAPDRQNYRQSSNLNETTGSNYDTGYGGAESQQNLLACRPEEITQLTNQLNQMRREQQIIMEENAAIKKRYAQLIPQIKELSSLLLIRIKQGITNTEQPTAQGSTKTASAIKKSNQRTSEQKKSDNSTPTASNSDNNTNSVIVPEGYTFISGGEIVSSEEWLEANLKQKKSESQIEKTAVTAENLTYDIRLTAEDRGHLEKISKLLVEHGITDQFIVANEGSYNLFLGRFTRLQNAADHRNKINSITGLSPEIVRKTMTQNTGSLPH